MIKTGVTDPFQEMAERMVYKQGRGEEDTNLEFDEDFVAAGDVHRFQRQVIRLTGNL